MCNDIQDICMAAPELLLVFICNKKQAHICADLFIYESVYCSNSRNYCNISVYENSFKVCVLDDI